MESLDVVAQYFISVCEKKNVRYIVFYQEQEEALFGGLRLNFKEILHAVGLMIENISTEELSFLLQLIAKKIEERCLQEPLCTVASNLKS